MEQRRQPDDHQHGDRQQDHQRHAAGEQAANKTHAGALPRSDPAEAA